MALTIKQLNGDASFLLTFERIDADSPAGTSSSDPFRILLNPCLTPSSSSFSSPSAPRARQACVSPRDVPEPDVIIISNSRAEHCDEATLRHFTRKGARPLILAEPAAAKVMQGWRGFDQDKVTPLHRWRDPRQTGRSTVVRIPVAATVLGGDEGLVTVAFITQKRERRGLRSAVGITYRPASSTQSRYARPMSTTVLSGNRNSSSTCLAQNSPTLPPLPAFTPLAPSVAAAAPVLQSIRLTRSMASLSPHAKDRGVSIIFSPHGIPYRDIEPYATSHLLAEAALPLTVLLHSFDTVSRPWWLGGTLTSGFEDGQEIIAKLGARVWISACDVEKNTNGLMRRFTRRTRYTRDEVRQLVHGPAHRHDTNPLLSTSRGRPKAERPTEVLALQVGEDVTVTSEGVWPADPPVQDEKTKRQFSIRHIPATPQDSSPDKTRRNLTERGPAAVAVA